MGFRTVGLWWSDIYRMAENFVNVKMRRMEQRGAAYFKRAAFAPIGTLGDDLHVEAGEVRLVKRFRAEGVPRMYQVE